MSFRANSNSISGGYNSHGGFSIGSPITFMSGNTSITPSYSHALNGSSHFFGGGGSINHQINKSTSVNVSGHIHGKNSEITAGFSKKF